MKADYEGEQSRDSVMSEIAALSLRTGRPMRDFYRLKPRLSGFAYVAMLLCVLIGTAISWRFRPHGSWRVFWIPFAVSFAVTFVFGRFFPLLRYRIEIKRGVNG